MSVSWTPQGCIGKNSAGEWFCDYCETSTFTVMPAGGGAAFNIGVGFTFMAGLGDTPDGYSMSLGVASSVGPIPGAPVPFEIVVDVDTTLDKVTIMLPKFTLGMSYYLAVRVNGSCTGCGIAGGATGWQKTVVARARRQACEAWALMALQQAFDTASDAVFPAQVDGNTTTIGPSAITIEGLPANPYDDIPGEVEQE